MPSTVSSSRLGLAGLCILLAGQLLPMIDFSIVNVALDALAHSLGASETELELIVAVYGVAFAVCLAMGDRLGDNYGTVAACSISASPCSPSPRCFAGWPVRSGCCWWRAPCRASARR